MSRTARGSWILITLFAAACAPRALPEGPVVSRTGVVFEGGTPPTQTFRSQTAMQYLRQEQPARALALALEGIQADTTNPIHYFLGGVAYLRLGDYGSADSLLDQAQHIYPAYVIAIEPEREAAWVAAFNSGIESFGAGDWDATVDRWRQATLVFDLRPEAHANLASLLAADGRYDEATEVYRQGLHGLEGELVTRALDEAELAERDRARGEMEEGLLALLLSTRRFAEAEPLLRARLAGDPGSVDLRMALAGALAGQNRHDEALGLYSQLLAEGSLSTTQLFTVGVQLFGSGAFSQAAESFRRLTEVQPNSRDAWFNYANSLFAAEAWEELAAAGVRLVELDPLGENAQLVTARAQLEMGNRAAAVASLDRADRAPVHIEGLQMQRSNAATTIFGRITPNAAEPGTQLALRFTFYDEAGEAMGVDTVAVTAPPADADEDFEIRFERAAAAYRYELVADASHP